MLLQFLFLAIRLQQQHSDHNDCAIECVFGRLQVNAVRNKLRRFMYSFALQTQTRFGRHDQNLALQSQWQERFDVRTKDAWLASEPIYESS